MDMDDGPTPQTSNEESVRLHVGLQTTEQIRRQSLQHGHTYFCGNQIKELH